MRKEFDTGGRLADRQRSLVDTMADYLEGRRSQGLAKSSLDREERFCRLISGYFEKTRTAALSVEDCDRFLLEAANGFPERSGRPTRQLVGRDHIRRLRATLRAGLHNDMRIGLLSSNVADLAALPSDTGSYGESRALSLEELSDILAVADRPTTILIDLIGRHGLRPAEARAVTWRSLDLDAGTLRVTAQVSSTNEIVEPKTARATRSLRLPEETVSRIRSHRDASTADPSLDDGRGLMVSTAIGTPVERNNFARSLRRYSAAAEIHPAVTPYELRHTAITHQCGRGYHAWQVADWAGTSEKMIYLHYRHLLDETIDIPPIELQA